MEKRIEVKVNDSQKRLGKEKLKELSIMLNRIGVPNLAVVNKNTKECEILLQCDCCGELYCLKSYTYSELTSINIKEEIYNLLALLADEDVTTN